MRTRTILARLIRGAVLSGTVIACLGACSSGPGTDADWTMRPATAQTDEAFDRRAPADGVGPVGELFQVIVNAHDVGTLVEFYRDVMGFSIIYPESSPDYGAEDFVRFDAGGVWLVIHSGRVPENNLYEPRLSYMTKDIKRERARLLEAGVTIDVIRSPAPGVLVCDARDPEGNAFHLEEHVGDGSH